MLQSYRELLVWQKAMDLATMVYHLTDPFPKREIYGLAAQLRRASVSVPSNIAEGYGRGSRREYLQFLTIAQGSLKELELKCCLPNVWHMQPRHKRPVFCLKRKPLVKCLAASSVR